MLDATGADAIPGFQVWWPSESPQKKTVKLSLKIREN